ncbi:hypothetical protein GGF31_001677 [Allomyces arbusculus]|nr:hypothetical protein GGF31_001677 [Allomyces arbusculus]
MADAAASNTNATATPPPPFAPDPPPVDATAPSAPSPAVANSGAPQPNTQPVAVVSMATPARPISALADDCAIVATFFTPGAVIPPSCCDSVSPGVVSVTCAPAPESRIVALTLLNQRAADVTFLPAAFEANVVRLTRLERLSWTQAGFIAVPRGVLALSGLRQLDLALNQIRSIPTDLPAKLPRLESINLSGNPLTGTINLPDSVRECLIPVGGCVASPSACTAFPVPRCPPPTGNHTTTTSTSSAAPTATLPPPPDRASDLTRVSRLSAGAITGVAIGSTIGVGLLAFFAWYFLRRRRRSRPPSSYKPASFASPYHATDSGDRHSTPPSSVSRAGTGSNRVVDLESVLLAHDRASARRVGATPVLAPAKPGESDQDALLTGSDSWPASANNHHTVPTSRALQLRPARSLPAQHGAHWHGGHPSSAPAASPPTFPSVRLPPLAMSHSDVLDMTFGHAVPHSALPPPTSVRTEWAAIVRSLASKIATAVDHSAAIHVAGLSAWRAATTVDRAPSDRARAIAGVLSLAFAELGKCLVAVQCAPAATRAAHARGVVQENVAGFFAVLADAVVRDPDVQGAVRDLADEYATNLAVKLLVAEPGEGKLRAPQALAVAGVFRAAAVRWARMKRNVPGLVLAVPRAGARWDPRWMVAVGGDQGGETVVLATVPAAVVPEAGVVVGPARVWVAK